jgi:hypothetical protein
MAMKNITLAVDDEVLEGVRKIAANRGTTVNAIVREHLTSIATQEDKAAQARRELVELSNRSEGRLGPDFKWNRGELYDRDALRRFERPDLCSDGTPSSGSETKKGE